MIFLGYSAKAIIATYISYNRCFMFILTKLFWEIWKVPRQMFKEGG